MFAYTGQGMCPPPHTDSTCIILARKMGSMEGRGEGKEGPCKDAELDTLAL